MMACCGHNESNSGGLVIDETEEMEVPLRASCSLNIDFPVVPNSFKKVLSRPKPTFALSNPSSLESRTEWLMKCKYALDQLALKRAPQIPRVFRTGLSDFVVDPKDLKLISPERDSLCFLCQLPQGTEPISQCAEDGCPGVFHDKCVTREVTQAYYLFFHRHTNIKCFRHFCNRCFAENLRTTATKRNSPLSVCKICSKAYHSQCTPPGCDADNLICPAHTKISTVGKPHMPFCFNCAAGFGQNGRINCDFCVRSFHKTCGQFIVDVSGGIGNRICSFCQFGYFVKTGDYCHVMLNGQMQPAQVVGGLRSKAPGYFPVIQLKFLFYKKMVKHVVHVYHGDMVPFTFNDAFCTYYRTVKLKELKFYEYVRSEKSTANVSKLPAIPLDVLYKEFTPCEENLVPKKAFLKLLHDDNHAQQCDCQVEENGMKCLDSCPNRRQNFECRLNCGPGCMNGPAARNPDVNKLDVFACPIRGKGLRATVDFAAGEPIGEYRGKIMSKEEVSAYMTIFVDNRNIEDHLYYMEIGNTGLTVNARQRGALTRFANHSCKPNTSVMCITGSDNVVRQMLYAKVPIKKGTEITFDYAMDWDEFNKVCRCGSEDCSGYLNGRMQNRMKIIKTVGEYPIIPTKKKKQALSRGRKRKNSDDASYPSKVSKNLILDQVPQKIAAEIMSQS
ncbi:unnamed protein product [Bursaphelenchus xylophilus]|uniref:(pine wood nematode) hypothetical protein n=1 Tax=Bursaphelenchus xylophilus TaxID=6326 RepID=A0A1I7SQH9_BURXY|nr:unnamed protein product [Bursaphelenchus xylophilus]CAG9109918.1 unnamed protein product [Bursaphelenchus xylophilus]